MNCLLKKNMNFQCNMLHRHQIWTVNDRVDTQLKISFSKLIINLYISVSNSKYIIKVHKINFFFIQNFYVKGLQAKNVC